jgi:hypothetical protein
MKRRMGLAIALLFGLFVVMPATGAAFNPFGTVDCSDAAQAESAVCASKTSEDPLGGTDGILMVATNIIAYLGGVAAIIIMIVGGIYYITSDGDSAKISGAKKAILYAIVGLAVIVLARALITFVIGRL